MFKALTVVVALPSRFLDFYVFGLPLLASSIAVSTMFKPWFAGLLSPLSMEWLELI